MHNRRINAKVDLSILRIKIERIYDNPRGNNNSFRILVDRLWPRGLSKDMVRCCSKLFVKEMVWPRRKEMGSIQTPVFLINFSMENGLTF